MIKHIYHTLLVVISTLRVRSSLIGKQISYAYISRLEQSGTDRVAKRKWEDMYRRKGIRRENH